MFGDHSVIALVISRSFFLCSSNWNMVFVYVLTATKHAPISIQCPCALFHKINTKADLLILALIIFFIFIVEIRKELQTRIGGKKWPSSRSNTIRICILSGAERVFSWYQQGMPFKTITRKSVAWFWYVWTEFAGNLHAWRLGATAFGRESWLHLLFSHWKC